MSQADVSALLRIPRILWAALLGSTVLFFGMLFVVPDPNQPPPDPVMLPALAGAAVMSLVMSIVLPMTQLKQAVAKASFDITEEADTSASDVIPFRDAAKRRVFAKPDAARRVMLMRWQTPFILGMALSESVSLFGFVLGFLGFPIPVVVPFFVVCWISMLARFPTPARVFGPFEAAAGAKLA